MTGDTMGKYRMLILTEHRIHSPVESVYSLGQNLALDPDCAYVDVASRGVAGNAAFFQSPAQGQSIRVRRVGPDFLHSPDGRFFQEGHREADPADYDVYWLRLPRSNSMGFFRDVQQVIPSARMVNRPDGIALTGSKDYLLHFPEVCAPIQMCRAVEEVESFAKKFPIVLKPLNNSGGKGLLRIGEGKVMDGNDEYTWEEYLPTLESVIGNGYLGMKFLKNVSQGDKRVIVANGHVVAAALRKPAEGSWLCNVSLGGSSEMSVPNEDELEIAARVTPRLLQEGVALFGFDTLVEDDGRRVLSELNTSCVNGIYPAGLHSGRPIVAETAAHLWAFIKERIQPKL